jgi:predicted short-subunit dehydrogenase-like oxidoreductase (DUF2520 family)
LIADRKNSIAIAGAGRVARALGRLLVDAGEPVVCIAGRNLQRATEAAEFVGARRVTYDDFPPSIDRLLIAVPDGAISEVAERLALRSRPRVALHTSGALGTDALAPLRARRTACGTLHPLQTISGDPSVLRGISFAVWGDAPAVKWAEQIVALAQGQVLRIAPEMRPRYHAAAVMTSNYVMALIDAGQTLLEQCGVEPEAARRALGPLIRQAVDNALTRGPVDALTGPIERGDLDTVSAHLKILASAPEQIRSLYRAAGRQTVDMARRRGLDAERAGVIDELLAAE